MAINIKQKPAATEEASAHDEAAAAIETEVTKTYTKDQGKTVLDQQAEHTSEPVPHLPVQYERITVGMAFKMPVADFTMLEFVIHRAVPYDPAEKDPDAVFEEVKTWVEGHLNKLLEENNPDAQG